MFAFVLAQIPERPVRKAEGQRSVEFLYSLFGSEEKTFLNASLWIRFLLLLIL